MQPFDMHRISANPAEMACVSAILHRCLRSVPHCQVWIFGSRARGTTKRYADLDIAIDLGRPMQQDERLALIDAFDDSDLPYKVDIVDLFSAQPAFVAAIRKDFVALPLQASHSLSKISGKLPA